MKIEISKSSGRVLDWLVTTIEDPQACTNGVEDWISRRLRAVRSSQHLFHWSISWAEGGSIREREGIDMWCLTSTIYDDPMRWTAMHPKVGKEYYGHTPLLAAMRCYVAFRLGDFVEVPDGLA